MIDISYFISFILIAIIFCYLGFIFKYLKNFIEGFEMLIAVLLLFYSLPMLIDILITFIINKIGITL